MIYVHITPEERAILEAEFKHTEDVEWYRRVKIIALSAQGTPVPTLARLFDRCRATVRTYIQRYNATGLAGLRRQSSPGSPVKIPLTHAEWTELLHRSPCQFEPLQTAARNWTQGLVRQYLRRYHGVAVTQSAISKHLKALGFRWNRGKLTVTSPDPLYTVKRERIEALKKKRWPAP